MKINLKIRGFDELLAQIERAGASAERAAAAALEESAKIMQTELKTQMDATGVSKRLIDAMPDYEVESKNGAVTAHVGYELGEYDPRHLSDGWKAMFINYGTPNRSKHGKIDPPREFVQKAKKEASPKMKKAQRKVLNDTLKGIGK